MTRTPESRFANVRLLGTRTLVPLLALDGAGNLFAHGTTTCVIFPAKK